MGGKGVNQKDRILASLSFVFLIPITLVIAGLDIGRFHWTQSYSFIIQMVAIVLYIFGNLLGRWAMGCNKYFSTFVRIQDDRGHKVESGGPYRYIFHRSLQ